MIWILLVGIRILVADILAKILQKILAVSKSRERAFIWQFFFAALIAWLVFFISRGDLGHLTKNTDIFGVSLPILFIIAGIGILNGFACYCQWRAQAISMSKSAVISIPDDIIALVLIYLVAPEIETPFLNPGIIIGVAMCFTTVMIFSVQKSKGGVMTAWVLGYTLIWGTATFLFRIFAGKIQLPWQNFLIVWYTSSLISACVIFQIAKIQFARENKVIPKMTTREILSSFSLSLLIFTALGLYYMALKFGALTTTKPIFLISAMVGPMLVGFLFFKEKLQSLGLAEKIGFIIGISGALVIALSFPYHLVQNP